MIRLAAPTIVITEAGAPTGAVAVPSGLIRAGPLGRVRSAAMEWRSAFSTFTVTIPVAVRWWACSNATTCDRVFMSKLPVIVVE